MSKFRAGDRVKVEAAVIDGRNMPPTPPCHVLVSVNGVFAAVPENTVELVERTQEGSAVWLYIDGEGYRSVEAEMIEP